MNALHIAVRHWSAASRVRVGFAAAIGMVISVVGCTSAESSKPSGSPVDIPLPWAFERQWAIGGIGDSLLELSNVYNSDVGADSVSHLWVIDHSENRLVEYDSGGTRLRTLGGRGRGPGEFDYPQTMQFSRAGDIRVRDLGKNSIVVFASDGSVQPEEQPHPRLKGGIVLANGDLVGERYSPDTSMLRTVSNGEVRVLATFVPPEQHLIPDMCSVVGQEVSPVFAPTLLYGVRGNRMVYSTGDFRLTLYEPGQPDRVLTRAAPKRVTTTDMARQHLGPGSPIQIIGRPICYFPADTILKFAGFAKELPAYSRVLIAPDGRIWALQFAVRGETMRADIYDPVNGYEGTVQLGEINPTTFLANGSVVSIEKDSDDVPVIAVYRVQRRLQQKE